LERRAAPGIALLVEQDAAGGGRRAEEVAGIDAGEVVDGRRGLLADGVPADSE
jgi:hypothetical protein